MTGIQPVGIYVCVEEAGYPGPKRWSEEYHVITFLISPTSLPPFNHLSSTDDVYLDTAGRCVLPVSVQQEGYASVAWKANPWKPLPGYDDMIRDVFCRLIEAESMHCISFAPSTAFAMTLAARNIYRTGALRPGRVVLLMESEMESNVYPWQDICRLSGARLVIVPTPMYHSSWTEEIVAYIERIGPDAIAVMAISCVHWCSGELIDVECISRKLRERNPRTEPALASYVCVDGTQSIGAQPINVQAVQADFVACSVHKWLLSPYGMSIMYLHPRHHDTWEALDKHDRNRAGNDEAEWVEVGFMQLPVADGNGDDCSVGEVGYPNVCKYGAKRINSAGRPNPIILPMVYEGLRLLMEWKVENINAYLSQLIEHFAFRVTSYNSASTSSNHFNPIALRILSKPRRSGHIIGIEIHPNCNLSPGLICKRLKQQGVHVSCRQKYIRVSPYVYNSTAEMDKLYNTLEQILLSTGVSSTPYPSCILPVVRRKRILVVGGSGWLGQRICKNFLHSTMDVELHVTYTSTEPVFMPHKKHCYKVDFSDSSSGIEDVIEKVVPDVVIHTAAQSSPARCASDPSTAYKINCPVELVVAIKQYCPSSLLLFMSTDLVYSGDEACVPFFPGIPVSTPSTVYGKTKSSFENEVLTLSHGLILRLSNMIGGGYVYTPPCNGGSVKFLQWVNTCCLKKDMISLKSDEYRSFVFVNDVVKLISSITEAYLSNDLSENHICWQQRVYNVGGPQGLSRLQFAEIVARAQGCTLKVCNTSDTSDNDDSKGCNKWMVTSVLSAEMRNTGSPSEFPPQNVTMDSSLTTTHFGVEFQSIEDGIKDALRSF